jgi:Putative Flp pilus-assembly TadE/G-like
MSALFARMRDESGQALVFVIFALFGLFAMTSLVIDGGSWFRTQRQVQTAADAAALAGAQDLPHLPPSPNVSNCAGNWTVPACKEALKYAQGNYSGLPEPTVTFPTPGEIDVVAEQPVSGIFFRMLSATAKAHARAGASVPLNLKNVAPIAVYKDDACIVSDPNCFGQPVTLAFAENDPYDPTKSKFGLLDLDRDGSAGAGDMKDWLENGYPDYLPINTDYPPANGEKNGIKQQLEDAADAARVLLFPVFDGANATTGYHIIGWAAFVIDDVVKWTGQEHEMTGHFVTFIATDLAGSGTIADPNFGVRVITLTE